MCRLLLLLLYYISLIEIIFNNGKWHPVNSHQLAETMPTKQTKKRESYKISKYIMDSPKSNSLTKSTKSK